ncbi:MAG: hypothetical protein UX75_C0036G0019 [Candidatus Moranbacteria bacterium GW2011_GWE2_47_10]|nr:MAG: hypothetical protein UX75_C0036G0019 [Candidatus Moranbacteria bacterium GW2011_GWE2_47_10]
MRTIKFRGELQHSGNWVIGNLFQSRNGNAYIIPVACCETDGHHARIDSDEPFSVDPATIGQFVGMVDEKGNEIYENDVLEFVTCGFNPEHFITSVVFKSCAFRLANGRNFFYACQSDLTRMSDAIVIGNLHDNQELLEQKA